jgi:hypothetical protein
MLTYTSECMTIATASAQTTNISTFERISRSPFWSAYCRNGAIPRFVRGLKANFQTAALDVDAICQAQDVGKLRLTLDRATPPRRRAAGACFRKRYNLPMLLPPSNSVFVPASEPHISICAISELALNFTSPGWGTF